MDSRKADKCHGCCPLDFVIMPINRPPDIDAGFWVQATANGEVCGYDGCGTISISAEGLIPLGVYTVWFATDRGLRPAAPTDAVYTADGFDPNRLVVNDNGILNYYVAPLDFNPFRGIPIPRTKTMAIIQGVIIGFHSNRRTNGTAPGEFNVNFFEQLSAELCLSRITTDGFWQTE
ncbi:MULTISPECIES: hypothetical protein [Sporomusa]|jgi:hypothetical protein|uniref:hypothetical protein n=1 Tax=Sporomusa TaxID=2375 RepID=UPI00166EE9A3|nr:MULTISPECIES: hypothetical protein [Sporomusa]MCM0759418.1 hypothetical protein [Sporomusa sphaeroides DSM 2875]HML35573.1 hypothetical protein [Sporomusa sphaeroides]